jgi:predicted dithiol-disulfide oxidoreductase (DUF899 family)
MMTTHMTATREAWLDARRDLLAAEKDLTRRSDNVARLRQQLPWVRVDKVYTFDTEEGHKTLKDMFDGHSQLLVYHFMFGPDYKAGCPSCSSIADGFNGIAVHLENHDVALSVVSRAPLAKLQAYKQRMGWTFPWASSHGGDFNFDFNVSFTEEQLGKGSIEYNYKSGGFRMDTKTIPEAVKQIVRDRRGHLFARPAGHERVRAGGWRRLPHLLDLCPRAGWSLGHVPVARPRPNGTQRDWRVVASPRRVQQELTCHVSKLGTYEEPAAGQPKIRSDEHHRSRIRGCLRRRRRWSRPWRSRLAVPRGGADLRRHGTVNRCSEQWTAGHILLSHARCVAIGRNGVDVLVDVGLPFDPLVEADFRSTERRPPVLIRRTPSLTVPDLPRP